MQRLYRCCTCILDPGGVGQHPSACCTLCDLSSDRAVKLHAWQSAAALVHAAAERSWCCPACWGASCDPHPLHPQPWPAPGAGLGSRDRGQAASSALPASGWAVRLGSAGCMRRFVMFYEGVARDGKCSIGVAVSRDGQTGWVRHPQPILGPSEQAGSWDGASVGAPCAVPMAGGLLWRHKP